MPSYTSIHLAERPQANIVAGKTFTPKQHPVPTAADLKDGEVLFQTLYLSLDPAMRGWLNPTRSYIPPVEIGAVMRGSGIGLIIASKSSKFPVGTYATGMCGWSEYAVLKEKFVEPLDLPEGAVPTDALGVLGMTGLTAYFGLLEIGQVKEGDFVVVSGAAGATGSVVGQIAKLKGATVLGLAGEDSKVRWLKEELGFDEALNYKDPEFTKKFRAATKGLIDVYFDNGKPELELGLYKRLICDHSWWRDTRSRTVTCKAIRSICAMRCYQRVQLEEAARSQGMYDTTKTLVSIAHRHRIT
jgi:NADPH-dependent curcumin reductase CurA